MLMIYADSFGYKTTIKTVDDAPEIDEAQTIENCLVGLIQVEAEDEADPAYIETKLVKNLKWAARKNDTNKVVIHTFAHLSDSKASIEISKQILDNSAERMKKADYEVYLTPFGYFFDLDIKAPGKSLARIFKNIEVTD
ncbi:MAG: threonyl-tRNA synthetase editing domain-containing protein [Candidatus Zixiibacteriota bacterium]